MNQIEEQSWSTHSRSLQRGHSMVRATHTWISSWLLLQPFQESNQRWSICRLYPILSLERLEDLLRIGRAWQKATKYWTIPKDTRLSQQKICLIWDWYWCQQSWVSQLTAKYSQLPKLPHSRFAMAVSLLLCQSKHL